MIIIKPNESQFSFIIVPFWCCFTPADSDEEMDELAQEEEREALALQKQMAASLEEQDFDADILEVKLIFCVFVSNKSKKVLLTILCQPLSSFFFIEIISLVKCYIPK